MEIKIQDPQVNPFTLRAYPPSVSFDPFKVRNLTPISKEKEGQRWLSFLYPEEAPQIRVSLRNLTLQISGIHYAIQIRDMDVTFTPRERSEAVATGDSYAFGQPPTILSGYPVWQGFCAMHLLTYDSITLFFHKDVETDVPSHLWIVRS